MAVAGLVGGGGFGPPPYINGTGASFATPLGQAPLSPGAGTGIGAATAGSTTSTALGSPFLLGAGGAGLAAGAGTVPATPPAAGLSPTQAVGGCGNVSLSPECGCANLAAPSSNGLNLANGLAGLSNLQGGGGCGCS